MYQSESCIAFYTPSPIQLSNVVLVQGVVILHKQLDPAMSVFLNEKNTL